MSLSGPVIELITLTTMTTARTSPIATRTSRTAVQRVTAPFALSWTEVTTEASWSLMALSEASSFVDASKLSTVMILSAPGTSPACTEARTFWVKSS